METATDRVPVMHESPPGNRIQVVEFSELSQTGDQFAPPNMLTDNFSAMDSGCQTTPISRPDKTPSIPEYFAGRCLFLTGGSGFIGKVFIEKIIRCCPDVKRIYLLMRPKRGVAIQDRMKKMLSLQLFQELRKEQPNFSEKIVPVSGDMMSEDIGLSPEDSHALAQNVSCVFHSAATVRFDEPMRLAIQMNVLGVRKMIKLCRTFKHLEAFVHVSTAYANCDKDYIEEQFYPPPVDPNHIIDLASFLDDEAFELITPRLLGNKPNTYTYTKQLAEHLLATEGHGLPLAVVRPSIVGASWKEPFPGWIDNFNGPSGVYVAAGKGILRTFQASHEAVADMVPVDIPVNLMLAVCWKTAVLQPKETLIYHSTTGTINPLRWGEMETVAINFFSKVPFENCFRPPRSTVLTNNGFVHDQWIFFSHLVPAYIIDMAYLATGRKRGMVDIYNRLHKTMKVLRYFTQHSWHWTFSNLDTLADDLSPEDKKMFYFDPRSIHWPSYIENYVLGTKLYILNEDMSGLPAAKAHLNKLRKIRYAFNALVAIIFWRALIARSQIARNVWQLVIALVFKFVRFLRITSTISTAKAAR